MTNKEIIQDFIDSTPSYLKNLMRQYLKDDTCFVCGMKFKSIERLHKAIKQEFK